MSDQLVNIVAYDPVWPDQFAAQAVQLAAVLAPWLAGRVQHIGSTSVPDLPAKPTVDMLAPVRSLKDAHDAVPVLESADWLFWPDDPCRHYRLWFLRPRPEARTHRLHVIEHDHVHAAALLAFRNALRADPDLRREYARLKSQLAVQHWSNRNAYSNAKGDFVARALRRVGVAAPMRDRLPE